MLSRRSRSGSRARAIGSGLAMALVVPMLALTAPAASAAPGTDPPVGTPTAGHSPAGDAGNLGLGGYIQAGANDPTQGGSIDVGDVSEVDALCAALPGTVQVADIPPDLQQNPPKGKGQWRYEVCGDTQADSVRIAQAHPSVDAAKAFCAAGTTSCGVFAVWVPEVKKTVPVGDLGRRSYLSSFLHFAPDLGTSPDFRQGGDRGLVTGFPAWFWNRINTTFPKAVGDLGLFGGLVATAWHLNTEFTTDGVTACRVAGLRHVGTEYVPGQFDPASPSPSRCGHTYTNQGIYNIHGCSTWLIVAVGPFFAIAFPITVCDDFPATVKDTQVIGTTNRTIPVR